MISTIGDWANLLTAMSSAGSPPPLAASDFADESGHRRQVDRPFISWLNREHAPDQAVYSLVDSPEPDVALWAALATGQRVHARILEQNGRHDWRSSFDSGSLFPQRNQSGPIAIEVWSEVELSSLHALGWLADRDASLRPLVRNAAAWLTDNLQPDNATNHPWAVHIFATIGIIEEKPEALLYAQTLLHNCQVSLGRPDALSSLILRDAASSLTEGKIAEWIAGE